MTVPGKGGRPRKWRSDADRQRAWRNRQTGAPEPPTMVQALDDGDELARTWQMIRDLGAELEAAKAKAKALQVELNRTRREHAAEDRRWGWITTENQHLRTETERLRAERDDALARIRDLETRLRQQPAPSATATPPPAGAPGLSRAARRQLEREQRRRH